MRCAKPSLRFFNGTESFRGDFVVTFSRDRRIPPERRPARNTLLTELWYRLLYTFARADRGKGMGVPREAGNDRVGLDPHRRGRFFRGGRWWQTHGGFRR